jgi:hypothetical protein
MSGNTNQEAGRMEPCADPKAAEFDFWIGEWAATWGEDGRGTNVVSKVLGGCVVLENFTDLDPDAESLVGMSVSTYVAGESCWKQTWVDNQGSYLDFRGGRTDEGMVLGRDTVIDGKPVRQRMVWYDITDDAFEWHWDRSEDGGRTWKTLWHIHYRRV